MDYKIKFEYKGIGKQAAGIRQKVLQSQKSATTKAGTTANTGRETISSLKTLNSSILKLITSNKELARSIGGGGGRRPPTSGDGDPASRRGFGGSAGFGRIFGMAAIGFAIQKINQIGNAYIQRTSQQCQKSGHLKKI